MKKKLIALMLTFLLTAPLMAQEGFIGEIRMFGGNFAPRGWALCDGQLLSISQNSALFSILGTTYGGDGRTTFGLPDLRGRAPVHAGTGPGLTPRRLGEKGGAETVVLSLAQLPAHNHTVQLNADSTVATSHRPQDKLPARNAAGTPQYGENANSALNGAAVSIGNAGGGQAHQNMQPYNTVNYIICLVGVFPSRN